MAEGIDTQAHTTAIEFGGKTIAVIGTPLSYCYPKENIALQERIASEHLLISQVPFLRYSREDIRYNRRFFPERNKTASALSLVNIIVEAGERSGTLIQAQASLYQGRPLIILNNNFENPQVTWPAKLQEQGAIRARNYQDITDTIHYLNNQ